MNYTNINITNFKGIKPIYKLGNYTVLPITRDINKTQLKKYIASIKDCNELGRGFNGIVYKIDNDLVIKTDLLKTNKNFKSYAEGEKLDLLYKLNQERPFDIQNSQIGIVAFKDNNDSFLVSTYVPGEKCEYPKRQLNRRNIDSIMKILTELDIGSKNLGRLLNNDLMRINIHFTNDKAGILDFEQLIPYSIEKEIDNIRIGNNTISPCLSDTSELKSNVRNFEYGAFHSYLRDCPRNEAKTTFKMYIERKSQYHEKMSKHYSEIAKHSNHKNFLNKIAKKEKIHSLVLKNPNNYIYKSEAIKIQLSKFAYYAEDPIYRGKINLNQIANYYDSALLFFFKNLTKNIVKMKFKQIIYYIDCIKFTKNFSDIKLLKKSNINPSYTTSTYCKTLDMIIN